MEQQQRVQDAIGRLREKQMRREEQERQWQQEMSEARRQNDSALLQKVKARFLDVLGGKVRSSGNTLRLKETRAWGGKTYETYRVKVRMFGYFSGMTEQQVGEEVRRFFAQDVEALKGAYIKTVDVKRVRNWWRGDRPRFYEYDAQVSEDTFNCLIFCGLPLITRPLAALYDCVFPRVSVKVFFEVARA